jgi:F-type H+-transporting ATPase subunit gamma
LNLFRVSIFDIRTFYIFMSNILSIKRRINAAKNVSKTTKAMQMIAASKLKRAQDAVMSTRPYVKKITDITLDIRKSSGEKFKHPYLSGDKKENKTLLIILSPDKGLCGSHITNLIHEYIEYTKLNQNTMFIIIGKKLEKKITSVNQEIIASFAFGTTLPRFDAVYPLIKIIDDYYKTGKANTVKVLTMEYSSIFKQTPKIITLLPIAKEDNNGTIEQLNNSITEPYYIYEPNKTELLNTLLKHYLEMSVYQQLIESFLSEQAARMMAMQNATDNANDIISDLQLEYNKTRQAKITSELLDITGGANLIKS